MTPREAIALLRRGRCIDPEKAAACSTCAETDEAIRALVAEGAQRGIAETIGRAIGAGSLDEAIGLMAEADPEAIAREVSR